MLTLASSANSCSTPSFIVNRSFPSGSNNRGAAVGDFNNDNKLDLAVVNVTSPNNTVSVLLGNGDGTFQNPIASPTATGAYRLVVGDFNRDDKLDAATAVPQAGAVAVMLGNGDGTFQLPNTYATGADTRRLAVSDFNSDNKLDIAATCGSVVSVLLGNGDGSFAAATNYGGGYEGIATADVDQDGDMDLALASTNQPPQAGYVEIFKNAGNGSFNEFYSAGYPPDASPPAYVLAFGNFNDDPKPELVMGNGFIGDVRYCPGTPIIGFYREQLVQGIPQLHVAGEKRIGITFLCEILISAVATGDFDGDGRKNDVAVTRPSTDNVTILLNVEGVPSSPPPITSYYAGTTPGEILTGDFNGDGKTDLAIEDDDRDSIQILLNAGGGKFNASIRPFAEGGSRTLLVANLNNDVYPDLVFGRVNEAGILETLLGRSDGSLRNNYNENVSIISRSLQTDRAYAYDIGLGDFNSDGKIDALVCARNTRVTDSAQGLWLFTGNGDGTFTDTSQQFGTDVYYFSITIGDFNSDNKLDAVATDFDNDRVRYFRGNGQGNFAAPVNFSAGDYPSSIVSSDFNSDGKLDLAVANSLSDNVSILLGTGAGSFGAPTNFPVGDNPQRIVVADLNADGKKDIVSANHDSNDVSVLLGNGMGGFSASTNFPAGAGTGWVTVADFNNDGNLDIATANQAAKTISILLGNGAGSFSAPFNITNGISDVQTLTAIDVNADRRPDIVAGNNSGSLAVLLNSCNTSPFATHTRFDFDGDGRADVAAWRPSDHNWYISQSLTNALRIHMDWGADSLGDIAVPADYDGDGKTDIAVWRPSEGNWYIIQSSTDTPTVRGWGNSTDKPVPADYDGDGKTDIAVYRPSEGNWYIIQSSTSTIKLQNWGASNDRLVPADYDGDGKADVAVFRPGEGNWYVLNSATSSVAVRNWGASTDKLVPADYDGDGRTDIAVWRPSEGNWYIINSLTNTVTLKGWGNSNDILVPADYDGDGRADVAVWRPSEGNWYIIQSSSASVNLHTLGQSGDIPVPSAYLQ